MSLPSASRPERVVIYRLGSLGDTVVALPCLHKVAQAFPDAERIVLTNVPVSAKAAPLAAVLGAGGLAHRFMAYPVGTRSVRALWALRRELRALGARTLVYLTPSRGRLAAWRDLVYFRLCGFHRVIGVPLTADLQRNRRGADGQLEWECERLARCLAPLGPIDLDDRAGWNLDLSADERAAAAQWFVGLQGRPWIAVNMGCKVAENDWGEANWAALLPRLAGRCGDHALLFVGAQEDAARADRVGARWAGPVLNLCGRVPPRVSAAAMAGARLFVGHDSGPLHLAACVGVPCVGLYGNKNEPRKWHPYGKGHRVLHEMRGVLSIGVDAVAEAVEALAECARDPHHRGLDGGSGSGSAGACASPPADMAAAVGATAASIADHGATP